MNIFTDRPVGGSFGLVWPPGWLWALQRPLTLIKQINKTPRSFFLCVLLITCSIFRPSGDRSAIEFCSPRPLLWPLLAGRLVQPSPSRPASAQIHHMLAAHAQPFSPPATHSTHPINHKVANIIDINCLKGLIARRYFEILLKT